MSQQPNQGLAALKSQQNDQELSDTEEKKPKRSPNDIAMIKSIKQLESTELDLHSPRFQRACVNLGIPLRDCVKKRKENFNEKGVADDIVELRLKHYQNRQIDIINRILEERRKLKNREIVKEQLGQNNQGPIKPLTSVKSHAFFSPQNQSLKAAYSPSKSNWKQQAQTSATNFQSNGTVSGDNQKRFASTSKMFMTPGSLKLSFEDHWSFEQEKLEKHKQKKVYRAQMMIDLEHLKLQKEREYAEKIKTIEKKVKQEYDSKKDIKVKHDHKFEIAKSKHDQIQRDLEEQQRRLLERHDKDMQQKIQKHEMLEKSRLDQFKRREQEFERKRSKIEKQKRDKDMEDLRNVEISLKVYENKIQEGNQKHSYQIQRVISDARMRNSLQSEKVDRWKEERARQEQEELIMMFHNEEKYKKKMQKIYKSTQDLHERLKEKKTMKVEKQGNNKKIEDQEAEIKLKMMMQRFDQAQNNIEQAKKEKEHELQLKHELRRLKEEDLKKERDRQRRIENQRKRRILKKTKEITSTVELMKQSEQELQKKRMEESIKSMIGVHQMFQTVKSVIQAKDLPIREKSRILRDHSLEIKPQFFESKTKKNKDENA